MAALFAITIVAVGLIASFQPAKRFGGLGARVDTVLREEYAFGSFRSASRLVVSNRGELYVTDVGEEAVLLFTSPRGKPRSVGGYGWRSSSFDRPSGLAADGLTLYVSDYNNHRIQRFDRNLNYLSSFSTRDTSFAEARFGFPTGVAVSRHGDLFVLDSENIRILKFSPSLQFERAFGGIETERGRLRNPSKIIVSTLDRVFVLDGDRVLEFDYFGNFVRSIGEGVLRNVRGFDANKNGLVVVSDSAVHWFIPAGQLSSALPVSSIVSSVPLAPLQDVALSGDLLYLLTPQRVVAMTVMAQQ